MLPTALPGASEVQTLIIGSWQDNMHTVQTWKQANDPQHKSKLFTIQLVGTKKTTLAPCSTQCYQARLSRCTSHHRIMARQHAYSADMNASKWSSALDLTEFLSHQELYSATRCKRTVQCYQVHASDKGWKVIIGSWRDNVHAVQTWKQASQKSRYQNGMAYIVKCSHIFGICVQYHQTINQSFLSGNHYLWYVMFVYGGVPLFEWTLSSICHLTPHGEGTWRTTPKMLR